WSRRLTPFEQVDQKLRDFVLGLPMAYEVDRKQIEGHPYFIWELKTVDIRVFGWFASKGVFVAVAGAMRRNLKPANKKYSRQIDRTVAFRSALDLDEPKFIKGVTADEVL